MVSIDALPFDLEPSQAGVWTVEVGGALVGRAPAGTDLYVNPAGAQDDAPAAILNAPTLLGSPGSGDFMLSAKVAVAFQAQFDAGVLLVWSNESSFAKFCFEYSPDGKPMIVSVVTRGVSDDSNAFTLDTSTAWLRIARLGDVYALHSSPDGSAWTMIRVFKLDDETAHHRIGFEVQSPHGTSCDVRFDEISYRAERLSNLRDGS